MPSLTTACTALSTSGERAAADAEVHDRRHTSLVIGDHPIESIEKLPRSTSNPSQSSTRTATSETLLATPNVCPPTVPATCVPCPSDPRAVVGPETIEDGREAGSHATTEVDVVGADARVDDVRGHAGTGAVVAVAVRQRQRSLVDAIETPRRRAGLGDDGRAEGLGSIERDHLVGLDAGRRPGRGADPSMTAGVA